MMAAMPCAYCDIHAFASAHKHKNLFGEKFTASGGQVAVWRWVFLLRLESSFNMALVARMGVSERTRVGTMMREDQEERRGKLGSRGLKMGFPSVLVVPSWSPGGCNVTPGGHH
jgi:hypothetical protein